MDSMTGYGRGAARRDGREITVEFKAVNHRFLDLSFRAPKNLAFLEDAFRSFLNESGVRRGHVDIFINYANHREDAQKIVLDRELLHSFRKAWHECEDLLDFCKKPDAAEVLTMSGAYSLRQVDEDAEAVTTLALEAAREAIEAFLRMRRTEGEALARDLLSNLDALSALRNEIAQRAPQVPEDYRKRLQARLAEWQVTEADPQRIAQEVALMADRCAIDEELSRLESHIAQFADTVRTAAEAGKKLDFLLQEMNREINTIGSKASDSEIAQRVVAAKCIVEKLREQVQNVV